MTTLTAAAAGLARCHSCGQLSRIGQPDAEFTCPRCGALLQLRPRGSLLHAAAYTLAAAILYVPANVLPIMSSGSLFGEQSDTILSGVRFLWRDGSWALAILVFFASVIVPVAKLATLALLLVSVQRKSDWDPLLRTKMYRMIEFVGRWSMLDVYVVTLLVALVQWQSLAVIHAGPGALAFGAVVVLTMLASQSFDPRLIWDRAGTR
jgi:paraquat-inducible protein A